MHLTPNEPIPDFQAKLGGLEDFTLSDPGSVVVAGDFNTRALEWGMPDLDSRGRQVLEMATRTGLLVLNVGKITTFRCPGYLHMIPDVSFTSEGLVPQVSGWTVLE